MMRDAQNIEHADHILSETVCVVQRVLGLEIEAAVEALDSVYEWISGEMENPHALDAKDWEALAHAQGWLWGYCSHADLTGKEVLDWALRITEGE